MKKLTEADPETKSPDLIAQNVEELKHLFPDAFTEGKIDFEVLKQLLGGTLEEREEKYGLNWHGKRAARQIALTPSTGTLRPAPAESVDWDTTKNLMIEGDNLEVLKLLDKSYAGKVKLIYIDPPYNTGRDFVYRDDYRDNIGNYLARTGQSQPDGRKNSTNTEASGRLHTDWLNMIYPRLKRARNLLRDDGVIIISISDHEVSSLRLICGEIFGEENFSAQLVWKSRKYPDSRAKTGVSTDHEYLICFSRSDMSAMRGIARDESKFANSDNDPRGLWMSRSLLGLATKSQRPNLHYPIVDPKTARTFSPPEDTGWRYSKDRMDQLIASSCILFPAKDNGRPREKKFRSDLQNENVAFPSIIDDVFTSDGTAEVRTLFGEEVFDFTKPTGLLRRLIQQGTDSDSLVLDFFAGSGSTGEAVVAQNAEDGGRRSFLLVQLPEPLDQDNRDQKTAADFCDRFNMPQNIAELTKERLRRAAERIRHDNPMFVCDVGFRVFKLASSNIRAWEPDRDDIATTLDQAVENLKTDRTENDILFELLLKLGLELTVAIDTRKIAGHHVHGIGAGTLLVCLATRINADEVEPLALGMAAWHKELAPAGDTTVVFRDSAFADDVAKTNVTAILQQNGIENVRSL